MSQGRSAIDKVIRVLFAAPFLLVGTISSVFALKGCVEGDAKAGSATLPFGVIFFVVGAFLLRSALRGPRSPEALASRRQEQQQQQQQQQRRVSSEGVLPPPPFVAGYRQASPAGQSARERYGAALEAAPMQKLGLRKGRVLAHEISLSQQESMFFRLGFAVIWNLATFPFLVAAVKAGSLLVALFLGLFVAVGALVLYAFVRQALGRRRLPRVEVDAEPAFLGDELRVHVEQRGPARITRYRVGVRCREIVRYTVGTSTRTETHDVLDVVLFDDAGGPALGVGESKTHDLHFRLPADAPPSFESHSNQILWTVEVLAEIRGWPDYSEGFAFRALPRPVP